MRRRALRAALLAGAVLASTRAADAGGLYLSDRGVRPLGRGGAFIAGGDDLGAIGYNPAGLFEAGSQILIDASWVGYQVDYTRQSLITQVDPNTGQPVTEFIQTYPTVEGSSAFVPIPTAAISLVPHEQWVLAFGVVGSYASITSFPEEVEGQPAPQRYSLLSLEGSALAVVGGWAAYAPTPEFRFGFGLEILVGSFRSTAAFSGCLPDRFFCAEEDPDWDVYADVAVAPIVAPTGRIGAVWIPHPKWRLGLMGNLPTWVRAPGTIKTRLPATPVFERASQQGEDVTVSFELPWAIKAGVEVRPTEGMAIELGGAVEGWSMHDEIRIEPDDVALVDVAGFPKEYRVPETALTREFQESVSVRLGGEYRIAASADVAVTPRLGVAFETSAIPEEYMTALTTDAPKVTTSLGFGLHVGRLRIDAVYAHVFAPVVEVDPREAQVSPVVPVAANPPPRRGRVNGGIYDASVNVVGLGFAYTIEAPSPKWMPKPEPEAGDEKAEPKPKPKPKEPEPDSEASDEEAAEEEEPEPEPPPKRRRKPPAGDDD